MKSSHRAFWLLGRIAAVVVCALFVVTASPASSQDRQPSFQQPTDQDDFRSLFDGETLAGWVKRGGDAPFTVVEGAIVGQTIPNTSNTFLCTEDMYGDFILELQFQCDDELNSGVQIRSNQFDEETTVTWDGQPHTIAAGVVHGYQVEIDPNDPPRSWIGGVYDEGRRGIFLYPGPGGGDGTAFTEQGQRLLKRNDWNDFRIECRGDQIRTWLNGEPRADFHDDMTAQGFIGLQVHGVGDRTDPLRVRWRNIRIQELSGPSDGNGD
jgi:hypothetical protein